MEVTKHTRQEYHLKIDGMNVQLARVKRGLTITELAEESGVTRKTISEIERGYKKRIRYSTMDQIAITLGKQVEDFCTHIQKVEENINEF